MVDVSSKPDSIRTATASGKVILGKMVFDLVKSNQIKKGDVLTTAQIAGINAAKQTWTLVPLCHPVALSKVDVTMTMDQQDHTVCIDALAKCTGKTGVEMEALTAVSVAALTVYDMCKGVSRELKITDIRLTSKTGGTRGDYFEERI
ncbi:uncharacterized protein LOC135395935 [Ornithodoros turicata]|uniref:uncharacterized protein LOC135395935 n=1 Tax=Ornithodoros turicata TaxID=34597 RepID=UPI003139D2C3